MLDCKPTFKMNLQYMVSICVFAGLEIHCQNGTVKVAFDLEGTKAIFWAVYGHHSNSKKLGRALMQ
jgi:hypothetical protein